jgi:DNA helicase-2/ATP-dependent DNA helicase PcrA
MTEQEIPINKYQTKEIDPTDQQKDIIAEEKNCVVIACPGSGKTFVLSQKIRKILPTLPDYKGVIAISYTNKASDELKKCLKDGLNKKGSFFGTMDSFYISEIIRPFGKQIFKKTNFETQVVKVNALSKADQIAFEEAFQEYHTGSLTVEQIDFFKFCFLNGKIILNSFERENVLGNVDTVGILANYIFDNSYACQRYLKAKYSHIMIDEYQDSGKEQHSLFLKLKKLGIISIAVGDARQSIFAFAGKDPKFLLSLPKESSFAMYPLDINHRSHLSIVNYSLKLLNEVMDLPAFNEIRIFEKCVIGMESDIGIWLNDAIPYYCSKYDVDMYNKVGILTKNNRTGSFINKKLNLDHKFFINTNLDANTSLWALVFCKLLEYLFDTRKTKFYVIKDFMDSEKNKNKTRKIFNFIDTLKEQINDVDRNFDLIVISFIKISSEIFPQGKNLKAIENLKEVLSTKELLDSYKPAHPNEIQIMTIHKSKGLEFDIVFHLDLYEWILPSRSQNEYGDYVFGEQDLNLHFVGITRAKECCVLCWSTLRKNYLDETKQGNKSEFLQITKLISLRQTSEI